MIIAYSGKKKQGLSRRSARVWLVFRFREGVFPVVFHFLLEILGISADGDGGDVGLGVDEVSVFCGAYFLPKVKSIFLFFGFS